MGILFRPVGLHELALIWDQYFRGFPARLSHQPIFYPVANRDYAQQIASKWNVDDEASGYCGYVTRFKVTDHFLAKFEPKTVGASSHVEYWIPAEQLAEFNNAIEGLISVESAFFGPKFQGHVPQRFGFKGKNATEQFVILHKNLDYSVMDFGCEISANAKTIYLNYCYWMQTSFHGSGIDEQRKLAVLEAIRAMWGRDPAKIALPACR